MKETVILLSNRPKAAPMGAMLLSQSFGDLFTFEAPGEIWGMGVEYDDMNFTSICAQCEKEAWLIALDCMRTVISDRWQISRGTIRPVLTVSETDPANVVLFPGLTRVTGCYLREKFGEVWVRSAGDCAYVMGCLSANKLFSKELGTFTSEATAWLAGIDIMEAVISGSFSQQA